MDAPHSPAPAPSELLRAAFDASVDAIVGELIKNATDLAVGPLMAELAKARTDLNAAEDEAREARESEATANRELADALPRLRSLLAERDDARRERDEVAAELAACRASHPITPGPEPLPLGPIIGLSARDPEWEVQAGQVRGIGARRIFADLAKGGEHRVTLIRQAVAEKLMPVVSYKVGGDVAGAIAGKYDEAAKAAGRLLASLGVQVRVVIWHEPNGDLAPADFVRINKRLIPLIRSAAVKVGTFINGWLIEPHEAHFSAFLPDDLIAMLDWWGIDAYHEGTMDRPDPDNTPGRRIRNFLAYAVKRKIALPIGIGEYNGFTGAALADAGQVILSSPIIEFACVWSSATEKHDFRLTGDRLAAVQATLADHRTRRVTS